MTKRWKNVRFVMASAICFVLTAAGLGWAAAGGNFILGGSNTSGTTPTTLTASPTPSAAALQVTITGTGSGPAIKGIAQNNGTGVMGSTAKASKFGITGTNTAGTHGPGGAVLGTGGQNTGVWGSTNNASSFGTYGVNTASGGVGAFGLNSSGTGVFGSGTTGVEGESASASSFGVVANNTATTHGTGAALFANGNQDSGVEARSANGSSYAVYAANSGGGTGVYGSGGTGMLASGTSYGLYALTTGANSTTVFASNSGTGGSGVKGFGNQYGVYGNGDGVGVYGTSASGDGIEGVSSNSNKSGVYAHNTGGGWGLHAIANSGTKPAVYAANTAGKGIEASGGTTGVFGTSSSGDGMEGVSSNSNTSGVYAHNTGGGWGLYALTSSSTRPAVYAANSAGDAVSGVTNDINHAGVYAENTAGNWGFYTPSAAYIGNYLDVIGDAYANTFNETSDRAAKANFSSVDPASVLAKVSALPISTWNYKSDVKVKHIGPVAQDFTAAFGLGADDKHIATVDADGVALAAIKGLHSLVQKQDATAKRQQAQIDSLIQKLSATRHPAVANNWTIAFAAAAMALLGFFVGRRRSAMTRA